MKEKIQSLDYVSNVREAQAVAAYDLVVETDVTCYNKSRHEHPIENLGAEVDAVQSRGYNGYQNLHVILH